MATPLLALLMWSSLAGHAHADDSGVVGRSVTLSVAASTGAQLLRSTQKGAGVHVGPASATSELSGIFEVVYVDTPANRGVLVMPAPWDRNTGVLASYRNSAAPAGPSPVKKATIRNGSVAKLTAASVGGLDLSTPPGPGGVVTIFTRRQRGRRLDASHVLALRASRTAAGCSTRSSRAATGSR